MTSLAPAQSRLASIMPRLQSKLHEQASRPRKGRVRRVIGTVIHAAVEGVSLGELCELVDPRTKAATMAEVVGLMEETAILVPLGDINGVSSFTEVVPLRREHRVRVGPGLLGRVIGALGEPLDGRALAADQLTDSYPVQAYPPPSLERGLVSEPIQLGIKAIDGLLTCARGQRVGLFGAPGVGKSSLLSDIVRGTDADVVVVALVGERGREVREFVHHHLGKDGLARAVMVVATSDRPAIERVKAAFVATTIAEYFRDRGKNVLLAMDNLTRFARAQREIGLASGEAPTRRGFPASLFAILPRLLERSGPGKTGSITGLYSVLLEGDGALDPVAEEVQALLDGHIFLSSELAQHNHFPAVDILHSRSRLMDNVVPAQHQADAGRIRDLMASYAEVELLVRVGEYKKGADATADEAIAKIAAIKQFLRQAPATYQSIEVTSQQMRGIVGDFSS